MTKPYYETDNGKIYCGSCLSILKNMDSCLSQCCITSPPYYGLRDYGVNKQIGLEQTPELYVENLVQIFREVKKVLKDDGILWLNLGDSYWGGKGQSGQAWSTAHTDRNTLNKPYHQISGMKETRPQDGRHKILKPKDLIGIPWRVAFALQQPHIETVCVNSEIDRAWLAAMFDGDGCIGIRRFDSYRKEKKQVYQDGFVVYTVVTNNDVELLEKCIAITGKGKIALKQKAGTMDGRGIVSRKNSYGWRLDGNDAIDIIRAIHPYLIAKTKQACLAYSLDVINKNKRRVNGKVPSEDQDRKRFLFETIKKCNQREPVDIPNWVEEPKQKIEPGWYLRSDIIWCLSGGIYVYAKTQKGVMPLMIKDMARLNPKTIKLWDGKKWVQVLGYSKSRRKGNELELLLRSGERISCTPNHQFPTRRGLLRAKQIKIGDILESIYLPPLSDDHYNPQYITPEMAWFIGIYLAEGSKSGNTLQITGHTKEERRWERIERIVKYYGGSATRTIDNNTMNIRVYGQIIHAIINQYISGKIAKNKGLNNICWKHDNYFLTDLLMGYLEGDGHWDSFNERWRIGFTRNYNLERDLRVLSARLGFKLKLLPTRVHNQNGIFPAFRGEIRFFESNHQNIKSSCEVIEIRKARARWFYDIGVDSKSHLFSLASGILTHNSKPNPMPESVTDRPTKAHEYIFLLTKNQKYFYDADAIKEDSIDAESYTGVRPRNAHQMNSVDPGNYKFHGSVDENGKLKHGQTYPKRNKRSVWTVATKPYKGAHFATYPEKLIEPCVLAGTKKGDILIDPFFGAGTTGVVACKYDRKFIGIELNQEYCEISAKRIKSEVSQLKMF